MKVKKNDMILYEDSFNVTHIARVASAPDANTLYKDDKSIGVIIMKSIEESNLNSGLISPSEVIIKFDGCKNAAEVEAKYPEVWL